MRASRGFGSWVTAEHVLAATPEPAIRWLESATPAGLAELRLELAVVLERIERGNR